MDTLSVGAQPASAEPGMYGSPWWGGSARPTVTIASVFPQECRSEEKFGPRGGFTTYVLPAAARDGVTTLQVYDTGQLLMDWVERAPRLAPIAAIQVADSLVSKWAGFTLGAKWGRPGIWVCRGLEPTPEEIAENRSIQEAFFRGLVADATDMYHKGELKYISDLHRRSAEWLHGTGANALPWFPKAEFRALKNCPACGEEILSPALSCKHCQTFLPDFYTKVGLDPSHDPAVLAVLTAPKISPKPPKVA